MDQKTPFEEPGNSSIFLFREHSKNIVGNKGDFLEFFREQGNIDPPGGLTKVRVRRGKVIKISIKIDKNIKFACVKEK